VSEMMHCEDCGTKIYNGICPNCHKETYIEREFAKEMNFKRSDWWVKKLEEQKQPIKNNLKKQRNKTNDN
jgi:hypothetical protein